jgi:hypothetical protein
MGATTHVCVVVRPSVLLFYSTPLNHDQNTLLLDLRFVGHYMNLKIRLNLFNLI